MGIDDGFLIGMASGIREPTSDESDTDPRRFLGRAADYTERLIPQKASKLNRGLLCSGN
jgi:hypothetical protein